MSQVEPDQTMQVAMEHHRCGRLHEAEAGYRQVLAVRPDHADALHLLGVIAGQTGRLEEATELIRLAIAASPGNAICHSDLGGFLQQGGKLHEAIACYERAVQLKSEFAEAHFNLGMAWKQKSDLDRAIGSLQRAVELRPDLAGGHFQLGMIWTERGEIDRAIACYEKVLGLSPRPIAALYQLGNAWTTKGDWDRAIECYEYALSLKGDLVEAHVGLGNARLAKGQLDGAEACYQRALALNPNGVDAHNGLGMVWRHRGQPDRAIASHERALSLRADCPEGLNSLGLAWIEKREFDKAIECYERALAIRPDYGKVHSNLGAAWFSIGQTEKAIACYQRALVLDRGSIATHNNLLNALQYHPAADAQTILEAARTWSREHALPLNPLIESPLTISGPGHANNRDPDRRLRVGYVSADFADHASVFFLLPLFRRHDRGQFDVICYAEVIRPDNITRRIQEQVSSWRDTIGKTDAQVASLVRDDQIDILVDLKLHSVGNRLLVFARKPAPVQVTWLGYPGTTGLETIDYRLTDPYLDPPGVGDGFYTERSFRLPETFWCYDPLCTEPQVSALPGLQYGYITFASLNYFTKVNDGVLSLWAEVLNAVAGSHLILMAPMGSPRQRVLDRLGSQGIGAERIEFVDRQPRQAYLRTYHRVDITLDTFPVNGHTTSLDSLWMGVPVVTLAGRTVMGRAGVSQLSNLGLFELIANAPGPYVQIAADLATDQRRLGELRATLRQRMRTSPLMDDARFARNIEAAYRTMWRIWCANSSTQ